MTNSSNLPTHGRHILIDLWGCDRAALADGEALDALMRRAAESSGATVLQTCFHRFPPTGVSGIVIISESHLSIHTWPDEGFASADFYTCGDVRPEAAVEVLRAGLAAESSEVLVVDRGRGGRDRSIRVVDR
ncbi:MAG: adenosylmethionine decarboxylase [bacterium]|nr:adenosylmethionine decarboxylase [bacterium]